jgi:hypothetical protein
MFTLKHNRTFSITSVDLQIPAVLLSSLLYILLYLTIIISFLVENSCTRLFSCFYSKVKFEFRISHWIPVGRYELFCLAVPYEYRDFFMYCTA